MKYGENPHFMSFFIQQKCDFMKNMTKDVKKYAKFILKNQYDVLE